MSIADAANRAKWKGVSLARVVSSDPRSLGHVPRWVRDRHVSPLERRAPWWPYGAVSEVRGRLRPGDSVFEYGSGGSTLWFEDLGASVVSVEHEREWADVLRPRLRGPGQLRLIPPSKTGTVTTSVEPGFFDEYIAAVDDVPDESLDMVVVDGRCRVRCLERAAPKVRHGGTLLLDDAERERYQPAFEVLSDWGVERFFGLKTGLNIATTAVFTRP
jgi:hypothetical protein